MSASSYDQYITQMGMIILILKGFFREESCLKHYCHLKMWSVDSSYSSTLYEWQLDTVLENVEKENSSCAKIKG